MRWMLVIVVLGLTLFAGAAAWAGQAGAQQALASSPPLQGSVASVSDGRPDMLLSAATMLVTASLNQDSSLPASSLESITERVKSAIVPLFDFQHMTRSALARNWQHASPFQQDALVAEVRTLLVRSYSAALANNRNLVVEYKPLRVSPGETRVMVSSTVKHAGSESTSIAYDMEKGPAGWRVYDIKIAGVSLIATYRPVFAQIIRSDGVDGLIQSLSARNRQADSERSSSWSSVRPLLFIMYGVLPGALHNGR